MSRTSVNRTLRMAVISALVASLGLAACGRKGPLDPPPGASLEGVPQPNMPELIGRSHASAPIGSSSPAGNPGVGSDGQPVAPRGPSKSIPLDVLLN